MTDEAQRRIAELEQPNAELVKELSVLGEQVARLIEENRALRKRLEDGGGGGSGGGPTPSSLREKAEKQRKGKARRKAARAAAEPRLRGRGKRSQRPACEIDETNFINVPAGELPADADEHSHMS